MSKKPIFEVFSKPKRVNWKVVTGPELSDIQRYDLIFDSEQLLFLKTKAGCC